MNTTSNGSTGKLDDSKTNLETGTVSLASGASVSIPSKSLSAALNLITEEAGGLDMSLSTVQAFLFIAGSRKAPNVSEIGAAIKLTLSGASRVVAFLGRGLPDGKGGFKTHLGWTVAKESIRSASIKEIHLTPKGEAVLKRLNEVLMK